MPQNVFVGEVARTYDDASRNFFEPGLVDQTVGLLARLAAGGPALEFAIGTGRIALPLAARGVPVTGIEISTDMIDGLRRKPGGAEIPVVVGDMASAVAEGRFALVYLVFNTISNLLTQAEQVACFRNAAAHLRPGGRFVVELDVPQLRRMPPGEATHPFDVSASHIGFDTYDFAAQRLVSHHVWFGGDGCRRFDSHHRYAWPAELDLMAQLAGMHLEARWAGWDGAPFTGESPMHVSVWTTPSAAQPA